MRGKREGMLRFYRKSNKRFTACQKGHGHCKHSSLFKVGNATQGTEERKLSAVCFLSEPCDLAVAALSTVSDE